MREAVNVQACDGAGFDAGRRNARDWRARGRAALRPNGWRPGRCARSRRRVALRPPARHQRGACGFDVGTRALRDLLCADATRASNSSGSISTSTSPLRTCWLCSTSTLGHEAAHLGRDDCAIGLQVSVVGRDGLLRHDDVNRAAEGRAPRRWQRERSLARENFGRCRWAQRRTRAEADAVESFTVRFRKRFFTHLARVREHLIGLLLVRLRARQRLVRRPSRRPLNARVPQARHAARAARSARRWRE